MAVDRVMAKRENNSPLPDGGVAFRVPLLRGYVFRRYPVSIAPPEGFVGFITDGKRQAAGQYRGGQWLNQAGRPIAWEPTHWTAMESPDVE